MKHIVICLAIIFGLFGHGHGQTVEHSPKAIATFAKFRQIDLLTQIIPLALTKEQINKILPVVERARSKAISLMKDQDAVIEKLDSKVSDAIKTSIEKGVAPPKALLNEIAEATMKMSLIWDASATEHIDATVKVFTETCNAGQRKVAINSLKPELLDPSLKSDKMTDAEKLRFFVTNILLDPQAYGVLVQLAKTAP